MREFGGLIIVCAAALLIAISAGFFVGVKSYRNYIVDTCSTTGVFVTGGKAFYCHEKHDPEGDML